MIKLRVIGYLTNITMKINTLINKALIKKVELLPNVSEFQALKYGLNEYAMLFGITKIKRLFYIRKLNEKHGANRYLERQLTRLSLYAIYGETDKFNRLAERLIRGSKSFRLLALNRVLPDWYLVPIKELSKHWSSLSVLCERDINFVNYKRVWIDKKEGDYARPLGVPRVSDRAYAYMKLDILERWFKGSEKLEEWQHGGRSGKGLLTCWKQLIPKMEKSKYIYEFDIKGFFDHVEHKAILKILKPLGPEWIRWAEGILKSKPMDYKLPPEDQDIGLKNYNQMRGEADEVLWRWRNSSNYELYKEDLVATWMREDPEWWWNRELVIPDSQNLREIYKDLMNGPRRARRSTEYPYAIVDYPEPTFEDRAIGRDNWKDLNLPGQGVPQGLNTSPFLATLVTDYILYRIGRRGQLIMYMDDGLLFGDTEKEIQQALHELVMNLREVGLEIAPDKSGWIKKEGEMLKDCKFLGLLWNKETNTLESRTRAGTQVKFPIMDKWPSIAQFALENGVDLSGMREKFNRLLNSKAHEVGLKYGFLGCLISDSMYPNLQTVYSKQKDIEIGKMKKREKLLESEGYIWKCQDLYTYKANITNISSIASAGFLRQIKRRRKFW